MLRLVLEASWGVLGASGGVLGRLGASWGRLGDVLGASWGRLGASNGTVLSPEAPTQNTAFWQGSAAGGAAGGEGDINFVDRG